MDALLVMLKNVLVFIALAVPGFILVKARLMKTEHTAILSKLLLNAGLPFLIINSTFKVTFDGETVVNMLILAAVGLGALFLTLFLSKPFTAGVKDPEARAVIRFCGMIPNNGFLGIPLAMAVFADQPLIVSFVVILNIVTNLYMYTSGLSVFPDPACHKTFWRALLNPVLISFLLGAVVNLTGVLNVLPEIRDYSSYLSGMVTPISMIIVGMKLAEMDFRSLFTSHVLYHSALLKLVVFPVIITGIMLAARLVLPVSNELILATFVAFAMPTAGLAPVFAEQCHSDTDGAVKATLGSTVLSMATIPLLYFLLNAIL